jgi:hypothetical protein
VNNELFYKADVFVEYNSLTFGTNLASSGRITISKGTVITAPNYNINIADVTSDKLRIEIVSSSSNPVNLYTISNLDEELVHLDIDISGLFGNTDINFDELQMQGLTEYFDNANSQSAPFETVIANDNLDIDISSLNSSDTLSYCINNNIYQVQHPPLNTACNCNNTTIPIDREVATYYDDCQTITLDSCANDSIYKLQVYSQGRHIKIMDTGFFSGNFKFVEWCLDGDTIFFDKARLLEANADFSAQKTSEYYHSKWGINGYNGNGAPVDIWMHFPGSITMWDDGNKRIQLGDGEAGKCDGMVSMDIISHEFTHGYLTNYFLLKNDFFSTDTLRYVTTNALHEALSDIMSVLVRKNAFGTIDWSIGHIACYNHNYLPRHVNAPNTSKDKQAIYYKDPNHHWIIDTMTNLSDKLKLFYNHGGVISYWFYLLSEGGTGAKGDAVTGVGINTAENILEETLKAIRIGPKRQYTFEEFRDLTLATTILLFQECSLVHRSVAEAWKAVGLLSCDSFQVDLRFEQFNEPDTCKPWMFLDITNGSGCYYIEWYQLDVLGQWVFISNSNPFKAATCGVEYKVVITDDLLFCTDGYELTVDIREIRKIDENLKFRIRPTLAQNRVFFDLEVEEPTEITVRVFDQLGRMITVPIYSEIIFGQNTIEYNVSNLSNGLYYVSIDTPNGRYTKKFIKI